MSNNLLCSVRVARELTKKQAKDVAIIKLENYIKELLCDNVIKKEVLY